MTLTLTTPSTSAPPPMSPTSLTIGVLALQGAFIEHIHYLQRLEIPVVPTSSSGETIKIHAIPIRTASELAQCDALVIPGGESTVIHSVAAHSPGGLLELLQTFVRDPKRPVWGTCAGMILMAQEENGIGGGKIIKGKEMQRGWGGIDGLKVWRNLYGTQLESFEAHMQIPALTNPEKPFNCVFIRAPAVHSLRPPPPLQPTSSSSVSKLSSSSQETTGDRHSAEDRSGIVGQTTLPTTGEVIDKPYIPIETLVTLPPECTAPLPPSDSPLGPADPNDTGKVMIRQGRKLVTSFHPELSGDTRIHRYWVEKCVLGR